jgi:hypothetical protein
MARKPLPPGGASFGPNPPAGVGSPVQLNTADYPYGVGLDNPNFIPGAPHNLPPNSDRPPQRQFVGVSPGALPSIGPAVPLPMAPAQATVFDPYHYAKPIEGFTPVGVVSALLLPQPSTRRNYLMLRNSSPGAQVIFISFGADASLNSTLRLAVNEIAFLDPCPQSDMYVIASLAGATLSYAVSTISQ